MKAGTPCLELLKVTAMDGIARQGATVPPGQPTRPEPSVEGCKFWMDAHVNVEGEPIPLTTFRELRDCHDGNHVFAGFYTFEAEKIGDPSALWSCGGAVESGAQ